MCSSFPAQSQRSSRVVGSSRRQEVDGPTAADVADISPAPAAAAGSIGSPAVVKAAAVAATAMQLHCQHVSSKPLGAGSSRDIAIRWAGGTDSSKMHWMRSVVGAGHGCKQRCC